MPVCGSTEMRGLGEHPEPRPGGPRARVLALERVGHVDAPAAASLVSGPQHTSAAHLLAQQRLERPRQHHHPILAALALANDDGRWSKSTSLTRSWKPSDTRLPVP